MSGLFGNLKGTISKLGGKIKSEIAGSTLVAEVVRVGRHEVTLKKQLGEGGFAYVFLAEDREGRPFALKRMHVADETSLEGIRREIKLMQSLKHKNIVQCYAADIVRGAGGRREALLLMEYCPGLSAFEFLEHRRASGNAPSEREVLNMFAAVCSAVEYLHTRSPPVIHRDLKVENVLIKGRGSFKLCDFGSATTRVFHPTTASARRDAETDINRFTTMSYRSPEMVDLYRGQVIDTKADIWALGCLLYRLAFFQPPWDEESSLAILNRKFSFPRHSFSQNLEKLIDVLLTSDPSERPDIFQVRKAVANMTGTRYEPPKGAQQRQRPRPPTSKKAPPGSPMPDPRSVQAPAYDDVLGSLAWSEDPAASPSSRSRGAPPRSPARAQPRRPAGAPSSSPSPTAASTASSAAQQPTFFADFASAFSGASSSSSSPATASATPSPSSIPAASLGSPVRPPSGGGRAGAQSQLDSLFDLQPSPVTPQQQQQQQAHQRAALSGSGEFLAPLPPSGPSSAGSYPLPQQQLHQHVHPQHHRSLSGEMAGYGSAGRLYAGQHALPQQPGNMQLGGRAAMTGSMDAQLYGAGMRHVRSEPSMHQHPHMGWASAGNSPQATRLPMATPPSPQWGAFQGAPTPSPSPGPGSGQLRPKVSGTPQRKPSGSLDELMASQLSGLGGGK